jgi:hypothetical protein
VAKGFQQKDGIDYTETFSPIIKPAIIRILLSLAIHYSWPLKQLDVSYASLHGYLTEEVFMEQPTGFKNSNYPDYACKLQKSLYGLKQAPRAWFQRLSQALLHLGFIGSLMDTLPFMLHRGSIHIFVLIYVDDIIVTRTDVSVIKSLIQGLQ